MGCCQSSEATGDRNPQPTNPGSTTIHASSSTRRIAPSSTSSLSTHPAQQSQPSLRHSRSNISSTSRVTARRRQNYPDHHNGDHSLTHHYSRPLRPHPWSSTDRRWTRSQLARERREYFETRVSGRREIWDAIQAATELLRQGELETARAIVNAAGLIITNGDLVEGGYDPQGALYRVPEHIVQDPENVVDDGSGGGGEDDRARQSGSSEDRLFPFEAEDRDAAAAVDADNEDSGNARSTRDKGKGKEPVDDDPVRVRCRLSDRGGADIVVALGRQQPVATLRRRLREVAGMRTSTVEGGEGVSVRNVEMRIGGRLKMAYMGRMLDERKTLEEQGWKEGSVVNAFVVGNFPGEGER